MAQDKQPNQVLCRISRCAHGRPVVLTVAGIVSLFGHTLSVARLGNLDLTIHVVIALHDSET